MSDNTSTEFYGSFLLIFILWLTLHYAFYLQLKEFDAFYNAEWKEIQLDNTKSELNILKNKTEWILQINDTSMNKTIANFTCSNRLKLMCDQIANHNIDMQNVTLYVAHFTNKNKQASSIQLKQIEYHDEYQQIQFFNGYYVAPNKSYSKSNQVYLLVAIIFFIVIFLGWIGHNSSKMGAFKSIAVKTLICFNLLGLIALAIAILR